MDKGKYEEVYQELKGRTGLENEEYEKELIQRIAEIEAQEQVVPALKKSDWFWSWVIIVASFIPLVCYAVTHGIEG